MYTSWQSIYPLLDVHIRLSEHNDNIGSAGVGAGQEQEQEQISGATGDMDKGKVCCQVHCLLAMSDHPGIWPSCHPAIQPTNPPAVQLSICPFVHLSISFRLAGLDSSVEPTLSPCFVVANGCACRPTERNGKINNQFPYRIAMGAQNAIWVTILTSFYLNN